MGGSVGVGGWMLSAAVSRHDSAGNSRPLAHGRNSPLPLPPAAPAGRRTAEKIAAGLIIVMVQSGRTVSLVAKYRPPMPIMAVVVPKLKSTALGWELEGE